MKECRERDIFLRSIVSGELAVVVSYPPPLSPPAICSMVSLNVAGVIPTQSAPGGKRRRKLLLMGYALSHTGSRSVKVARYCVRCAEG
jgi:hypothetical protein